MQIKMIMAVLLVLLLLGCSAEKTVVVESETPPVETTAPEPAPVEITPVEPEPTLTETAPAANTTETATTPAAAETTHTVNVKTSGFDPDELTIAVGDTVIWKNVRTGEKLNKAFIIGTLGVCRTMKSEMYEPGEEFSYTFHEAGKCTYTDGVYTTLVGKITIE